MAYEDFTTFTEFDEGNDITVDNATKVSWVGLQTREDTGYLYKDKGANHFSGDFTHKFECQFSALGDFALPFFWMLANIIGDRRDVIDASEDGCYFGLYSSSPLLALGAIENGVLNSDTWPSPGPQTSTTYYVEIVRDDDGGANNTGRLTAYIRTGSHAGVLQDTLVVDCSAGEQNDFRYLYAVTTDDTATLLGDATGFTQNLDIGEGAAATPASVLYGPLIGPMRGPIQ